MNRSLKDSVVVITGASSGIGRASALAFAKEGASLVLAARSEAELKEVARECEQLGAKTMVVPTDVTDELAMRVLARHAIHYFDRLDVWVNNAAVSLFGKIDETPYEPYRRVIETNLMGYVHGARAAIPQFRRQGRGILINVSSVAGKVGQPYTSAYVASKFGIVGLSESIRMELRDARDIHVCTVLPGSIDTPLFQHAANFVRRAVKPMKPVYGPEKVASTIIELAKDPRREVIVGASARLLIALHTLFPTLAEKLIASQVEKDHFQNRSAAASYGNLYDAEPSGLTGGWREPSKMEEVGRRIKVKVQDAATKVEEVLAH